MLFLLQNQKKVERGMTEIYLIAIVVIALLAELTMVLLIKEGTRGAKNERT